MKTLFSMIKSPALFILLLSLSCLGIVYASYLFAMATGGGV